MKDKIKLFINSIKIRNKLILAYLIVVIITVSLVSIYLTVRMNEIVVNKSITDAENNVNTMQYRLEEITKIATKVSDMIYMDNKLTSLLTQKYSNSVEFINAYNNYQVVENYLKYYRELSNITIYSENDTLLSTASILKVDNEIRGEKWYVEAIEGKGKISWKLTKDEISDSEHLSLIRSIYDNSGKMIGVLVIDINNYSLKAIMDSDSNSIVAIDGHTILLKENYDLGQELSAEIVKQLSENNKLVTKTSFEGEESYLIMNSFKIEKSLRNNLQVLVLLPSLKITEQTNNVILNSLIVALGAVIGSLIIIIYFSKGISSRINSLRREMHRVVNGDFYIREEIYGVDEIGQLYQDLKFMIESIRNLINQVYIQEIQEEKLKASQKEAEFKMLSSQINPHFLYNTLETIRMKAFCKGDKEIADIVKKLGKIMRRNLEVSGRPVTLKSELGLISNYLEIQSMRFEGMVNYELIIDDEVSIKEYMILPLLLQPVVENAFVHGLEERKEKGTILIRLYNEGRQLIIQVEDNGIGIEEEKLKMLNETLNKVEDESKSIGMRNVNKRIKIHYGNEYGVKIESEFKVGTSVKIYLPMGES
ncbi:cache domain-containing sensor histidine kinase [Clostridium beijerinckii]|uniref:cache domain-containing sensor histidine kinase n=1 Tax=Clostridium beijerinckii TaxID=1520 RepID=UPI001494DA15|nr:sensor histidine kinase [Clostridium beijerinckii]NOW06630.1 two-component system sensor histidine kinase YesM [Clostridium beijerinckii]NYC00226.1 two-component system sensor histidine kinase YesM [Clostridium beijerinckii]